jgi:hypothetical protein
MGKGKDLPRWTIPLVWLSLSIIVSIMIDNLMPFATAIIFSCGWYLCYIFGRAREFERVRAKQ